VPRVRKGCRACLAAIALTAAFLNAPRAVSAATASTLTLRLTAGYQGDPTGPGFTPETLPAAVTAGWPVAAAVGPTLCQSDATYHWADAQGQLASARTGACTFTLELRRSGAQVITLTAQVGAQRQTARATIVVRGRLMVAIGDSIASGEGVPDIPGGLNARWQSRQCHRSARAAPALAAQMLQQSHPGTPVTFISLACSGATINDGLVGPYAGVDATGGETALPAQTIAVRAIAARRPIDALVISIGANDLHFGDVIRACLPALHPLTFHACLDRPVTIDGTPYASLSDGYASLDAALSGIAVRRVYLLQYFDPTLAANGATCSRLAGISGTILDKARAEVLDPLGAIGAAVARKYHWQYVLGVHALFSGHGYCTDAAQRWVVKLLESARVESGLKRVAGTLHPNAKGHEAIAQLIVAKLGPALFPGSPPPAPPAAGDVSAGVSGGLEVADSLSVLGLGLLGMRRTAPARRAWRALRRAKPPPSPG
jgi:lysophospholipase L1-like esterase